MTVCNPYAIAKRLLDQLATELVEARADVPKRMTVLTSPQAAVMEMCSTGWVAFSGITASNGAGGSPGAIHDVAPEHQVSLTMGVYRCFPVDPKLGPPSSPVLDSASRDILDDFEAMRRAALHAWSEEHTDDEWDLEPILGGWRPVTPQGGGHGSTMDVSVIAPLSLFADESVPMLDGDPRG
ncbi:hypothetical protein [Gordonia rubripertincta]|uniref:hypothetical protein n=1 Tax=Gordonia rubripertincta TaxID=36822 RepID=UPI0015FCB37F|nr:hypothetical protein [Gordonia rubripertincta]QMU22075.1 hypothetical protein H3V45_06170 [Gordonia rubripertincta]